VKTLYPKQQEALAAFASARANGRHTLDASSTGTGKTVVAAKLAAGWDGPVAVVCPKSVITSWERELAEEGVAPLFVLNYEKLRTGNTPWMSKRGKKSMTWNLPMGTLVLMDEVQRCKGAFTQNAHLLISLVAQGYTVHLMSATAAEDPTEMRALGYALGLHSLAKSEGDLRSWIGWMFANGCKKDLWGNWQVRDTRFLHGLRGKIYAPGAGAHRLTPADFPDSFRRNRIFLQPVTFGDARKIAAAYDDAGITPDIVAQFIEHGTVEGNPDAIVDILRARQLAEALKVPELEEMGRDLLAEGLSVIYFVHFCDTVDALVDRFGCRSIDGRQTAAERQEAIDRFQSDTDHVLVVNSAAGGEGISLHDMNGNRPRASLICPGWSAKGHVQVLGRIHRNGAQSDAMQRIVYAAGTIEEAVVRSLSRRLANLDALHGMMDLTPENHE
jgi:hypothetical protein